MPQMASTRPQPQPARAQGPATLFRAPEWDWAQAGQIGWWVRPDWRNALLGPRGLRLDEWRAAGKLTTVKTGPHRVVYRVDLEGSAVYIKHFLVPGLRAKVRQWVRRGKGRNEGKQALKLAKIGVPTITPVALGEQRKRHFLFENYLITPAIPDTTPLDEFVEQQLPRLPEQRQARLRQSLAIAMAELTAHLHDAGFVHGDFHPGNLLVRLDAMDQPQLIMIDLDAMRVRKSLSWKDAQANLALLNHYFWLRCDRADRYRFLKAYLKARAGPPVADAHAFARGIESATRAWAERLWRRSGKRCQTTNKYFRAYKTSTAWAIASRRLDAQTVRALMADPDEPLAQAETRILKDSRTSTVAELSLTVDGLPTTVIYKRFNRREWFDPLLCIFRPSRAWRAWQAAQHLASRGIPTPANLALIGRPWLKLGRRLSMILPREMYLITVKNEPSITLRDYLVKVLPRLDPVSQRRQTRRLTRSLARLIRTLHERSLSDRDLKATNILIEGDPEVPEPKLSLIDLVGVQLAHPLPRGRREQNLARLQLSLAQAPGRTRTDLVRFLRAYLPWSFSPREDWKALWRATARRSQLKEARNLRNGRVIS